MFRQTDPNPDPVPHGAKPAGEVRARWAWAEPSVWTERMLTALEHGVKGGTWYSLMDKVYDPRNLRAAFARVKKSGAKATGVDRQSIDAFEARLDERIARLTDDLRRGRYRPQAVRRVEIPKPGTRKTRPLGIPTVSDRVVQGAVRQVLEPIFERNFAEHSYGFRPGRSCKDALRRVDTLLKEGHTWVVDADLSSYFDTIPHDGLMACLRTRISDGRVLELVERFLTQKVMAGLAQWTPETGTPQGAVLSPLLSNIYLDELDHRMARCGRQMVRYADDFVILCRTEAEAREALAEVERWTAQAGLALHPDKTRIVEAAQPGGFDFLGYRFDRGRKWPSKKSEKKLRAKLRPITRRTNGHSLKQIVADVNRVTRGWFGYFKHGYRTTFPSLDGWIRMRLRSIKRRRMGLKGRARGADHQRWPNDYFARHGLFSMTAAHAAAVQSSKR